MKTKTYDIQFNNDYSSDCNGFDLSLEEAIQWLTWYNGTNHSYFEDYKGGTVSIVCNETNEVEHFETVV